MSAFVSMNQKNDFGLLKWSKRNRNRPLLLLPGILIINYLLLVVMIIAYDFIRRSLKKSTNKLKHLLGEILLQLVNYYMNFKQVGLPKECSPKWLSMSLETGWTHDVAFSPSGENLAWVSHNSMIFAASSSNSSQVTMETTNYLPFRSIIFVSESTFIVAVRSLDDHRVQWFVDWSSRAMNSVHWFTITMHEKVRLNSSKNSINKKHQRENKRLGKSMKLHRVFLQFSFVKTNHFHLEKNRNFWHHIKHRMEDKETPRVFLPCFRMEFSFDWRMNLFDWSANELYVCVFVCFSRLFDQPSMQTQTPEPTSIHQSMITWVFVWLSLGIDLDVFPFLGKSFPFKMRMEFLAKLVRLICSVKSSFGIWLAK